MDYRKKLIVEPGAKVRLNSLHPAWHGRHEDDPARQGKISESDYSERALWDDDIAAFGAMLAKCSTEHAPWYVIPSNHKWFRNLAVSQIIAATLEDLRMKPPAPSVDLAAIRAAYHAAANDPAHPGKAAKARAS
jgi:hypothetical protein